MGIFYNTERELQTAHWFSNRNDVFIEGLCECISIMRKTCFFKNEKKKSGKWVMFWRLEKFGMIPLVLKRFTWCSVSLHFNRIFWEFENIIIK